MICMRGFSLMCMYQGKEIWPFEQMLKALLNQEVSSGS